MLCNIRLCNIMLCNISNINIFFPMTLQQRVQFFCDHTCCIRTGPAERIQGFGLSYHDPRHADFFSCRRWEVVAFCQSSVLSAGVGLPSMNLSEVSGTGCKQYQHICMKFYDSPHAGVVSSIGPFDIEHQGHRMLDVNNSMICLESLHTFSFFVEKMSTCWQYYISLFYILFALTDDLNLSKPI